MAPKKAKKAPTVTAIATLSDDTVNHRHYIINAEPECISFWSLTTQLNLMTENELIELIKLNIDSSIKMKCNGVCAEQVQSTAWTTKKTRYITVKPDHCDNKCLALIKRII